MTEVAPIADSLGAARRRRLAWEAERLAEADVELEAGLYVDADERPCAGGYRVLSGVTPATGDNDSGGDVVVLRVLGSGQDRGPI